MQQLQEMRFWPMMAILLVVDIALGFAYAALPVTFDLGRDAIAAVQLVALAATMLYALVYISRDY